MTRAIRSKTIPFGLIVVVLSGLWSGASSRAVADPFRSAADAPAAWGVFAKRLKLACEAALHANILASQRLNSELHKLQAANPDEPPLRVKVSLWIAPTGAITRVASPPLPSEQATADLNALLAHVSAGPPPRDLLQPLQLMLSLAPQK